MREWALSVVFSEERECAFCPHSLGCVCCAHCLLALNALCSSPRPRERSAPDLRYIALARDAIKTLTALYESLAQLPCYFCVISIQTASSSSGRPTQHTSTQQQERQQHSATVHSKDGEQLQQRVEGAGLCEVSERRRERWRERKACLTDSSTRLHAPSPPRASRAGAAAI